MLTCFFQDSDFIVVLQTGFRSGFLLLGTGLETRVKLTITLPSCYFHEHQRLGEKNVNTKTSRYAQKNISW